ncbi:S-adenosyl-L-methionine-dependent methyltransferase [Umbelopsis sp. AD052]|nr:S-adenosyl-L-methionine-dependent methyltransferase [Umbelopsis sp. AD052]
MSTTDPVDLENKKACSSSIDVDQEFDPAAKFGSRLLTDKDAVFNHNAWDNVEWDEEQEKHALSQIERQSSSPVPEELREQYHSNAANYWNKFYHINENRFFKDRNWLRLEFPELFRTLDPAAGSKKIFEVGCGAGNTMFPLLQESKNPELYVYGADFSSTAVEVVKSSPNYDEARCKAFVWDLTSSSIPEDIEPESLDFVVLIFVLSAIHPDTWKQAVVNAHKMLKKGGVVLLRDYGRHDLAQLRFKAGRLLDENFYIRGDGTRVYFFTSEELESMFTAPVEGSSNPMFEVQQNAVDRRLIVNRSKKLKMYRVWLQCKFKKL